MEGGQWVCHRWERLDGGVDATVGADCPSTQPMGGQPPPPVAEMRYVPRAVWWGLEWARYGLSSIWHLPAPPPLLRGYDVQGRFDEQLRALPKALSKRLKYYRSYTSPELTEVHLRGFYAQTELDGNKEAYRQFLHAFAAQSGDGSLAPDPATFNPPLTYYDAAVQRRILG